MVIEFEKEYLSELYYEGKCNDKKHRFQPQVIRNYVKRIVTLAEALNVEALYPLNSLNYEVLTGSKKDISSIRIDKQYRLEFKISTTDSEPIITICSIIDITNNKNSMSNLGYSFIPVHPGEIIKEELQSRGISQKRFAEVVGVSYTMLNDILNGRRPVSTDFALLIEAATNINAEMLMNMQTRYNMQIARKDKNVIAHLENLRKICATLL